MTRLLQDPKLDFVEACRHVALTLSALKDLRENLDENFERYWAATEVILEPYGVEPVLPRICGRQRNRANVITIDPKQYFRVSLAAPFLDHMIQSMDTRFDAPNIRAMLMCPSFAAVCRRHEPRRVRRASRFLSRRPITSGVCIY